MFTKRHMQLLRIALVNTINDAGDNPPLQAELRELLAIFGGTEDSMSPWAYRYQGANGLPLVTCPECGRPLQVDGGISVLYTRGPDGGVVWEEPARLDELGNLVDLGAAARGFHSATRCGGCNKPLIQMRGVLEMGTGSKNKGSST